MTTDQDIQAFAKSLRQEIISRAQVEDEEEMRENSFTHLLLEYLEDADETDNATVCFHKTRGQKINAWGYHDEMERVDLFCSIYTDEVSPRTVTKREVVTAFNRLSTFLKKALTGSHQELEESSEVFDLAKGIHDKREQISLVRLFVLTNGLVKSRSRVKIDLDIPNVEVAFQIWDIQRLHRLDSSGQKREPIELDLLLAGLPGAFVRVSPGHGLLLELAAQRFDLCLACDRAAVCGFEVLAVGVLLGAEL